MKAKVIAGAVVIAAIVAGGAVAAGAGSISSAATTPIVKTGHVLGKKVIVTRRGMTLYSLSAETHGRFICSNGACLALWHPLTVAKGSKPGGAAHLGTIRRPDGRTQVTYEGKPVYTFVQDKKPGQAKGEGFKDVGTWHVASTGSSTSAPAPMTSPGYTY